MHAAWLVIILSGALFGFTAQAVPTQTNVDAYITAYGAIAPEQDPRVATAYRVFAKVKAVADKSIKRMPKLVVIGGATDAWAIALPSGHIVLSRKGLELCFKDADHKTAETRLAFILGHELAHLAHDDYWHHEVESFLAKTPDTQKIAHFLDQSFEARQAELAADDKGYLYAAMAGYPVNRLVDERKIDFFTFWMQQTQAKITSSHPFPEDRAALLRERFKMLQEKLALFEMGVRLAHFGRCADGKYFLEEFKQVFPEPAVLNNLGVCALELARHKMSADQANFYWLPFLLETETRAKTRASIEPPLQSLKTFAISPQVQSYLKEAVEYLEQAVAAAPDDLAARLNLATALLYQGRPHQARAVLSEALQFAPEDWQVKMLDALSLYEQSEADIDLWPAAVKKLETFPKDMPPAWRYNLARLLELRPRPQEAQGHWNLLAQVTAQLPLPVRQVVCAKQSLKPAAACLNPEPTAATALPLPWRWPVADHQATAPLTPTLRAKLFSGWEAIPFDYFQAKLYGFIHRAPDRTAEVMEMDQFVQLQVVKQLNVSLEQLPKFCSHPLLSHRLLGGEILTCDHWAVLTRDGQVSEAWWIAP